MKLYIYEQCPYCTKVITWLRKNKLQNNVTLLDAGTDQYRQELKSISGKTQAPFLVDTQENIQMPESLDIIAYLAQKYACSPNN